VVGLVPGTRAAKTWEPYADRIHYVKQLELGVAELTAGYVGLVVLVNKYDGVDLPGRACQLLILDGVPAPLDGVERREAVALTNSPIRRTREVQRIEQGMGRGVRDVEDFCGVLLLGANLGVAAHDKGWLELFSPATRAQLELSRDIASQISGQGLDAVRAALSACLDRDPHWVERSRRALAEIRYVDTGAVRRRRSPRVKRSTWPWLGTPKRRRTGCSKQSTTLKMNRCAAGCVSRRPPTCTSPIQLWLSSSRASRCGRPPCCCARSSA
jgi:hypothetical protein